MSDMGGGQFFWDYEESRDLWRRGSFHALIMAAYYKADSVNAAKLRLMWPDVVAEMDARYNAPGGILPDDWTAEPLGGPVPGVCGGLPEEDHG